MIGSDRFVNNLPPVSVHTPFQVAVLLYRFNRAVFRQLQRKRHRRVRQREGRSAWHSSRHIRDAVVKNILDIISRLAVRSRFSRLDAAALIDCYVHDYGPARHIAQHFARHQFRSGCPWNQHRAYYQIRSGNRFGYRVGIRRQSSNSASENIVQIAKPFEVSVYDNDRSSKPDCDFCGVDSDHASADYRHASGRNAGHPAHQYSSPAVDSLQVSSSNLNRHPARHFAHRRKQRKMALIVGDRFVSDAGYTAIQQCAGQLARGREMKIGEQY